MTGADPYRPDAANDAASTDGIAEILALSAALADEVSATRAAGGAVPEEQTVALAKAARLLRERGIAWPAGLAAALRGTAEAFGEVEPDAEAGETADRAAAARERMARLLSALRWGKAPR